MGFIEFLRRNAHFLIVGILLTFCSSFGQTFFISVFGGVIRAEFGLSNGEWGWIYSIGTTGSAFVMLWAGVLTDRFRVRLLGPVVLALLAASCLAMSLAPGPVALAVAIFALRFTGQGMAILVATVAMVRWFAAGRGKALSVSAIGVALGEAILPLIFVLALDGVPWRWLWVVAACVPLAMIPILVPLLARERTPQSIASEPQSGGMEGRQWARGEMLRHPLFWFVAPALLAPSAFSTAFFFHQVHLAGTKGWSHLSLVALFPVYTVAATVAVFAVGPLIDRIGTTRLMPLILPPAAAGFLVMAWAPTLDAAAIGILLLGFGQGLGNTIPNAFWAEYYGTRNMGAIRSLAAAVMVLGTAIGPGLTGALIDAGVDFEDQMVGIAAYYFLAASLVLLGVLRSSRTLPPAGQVDVVGARPPV